MTAGATAGPVKDFLEGRLAGFFDQSSAQVFLERLVGGSRSLAQYRVGMCRDILDLHAGHGAIMALEAPVHKHAVSNSCDSQAGRSLRFCPSRVVPSSNSLPMSR